MWVEIHTCTRSHRVSSRWWVLAGAGEEGAPPKGRTLERKTGHDRCLERGGARERKGPGLTVSSAAPLLLALDAGVLRWGVKGRDPTMVQGREVALDGADASAGLLLLTLGTSRCA